MSDVEEALRTLKAELSIEPSADFHARVRRRIADRPVRARRWTGLVPAAVAVALAIVVAMLVPRGRRGPAVAVDSPPAPAVAPPATGGVTPSVAPSPATVRTTTRRPAALPAVRPLVDRDEAIRIARYVTSVRERPFADESLPYSDPRTPLVEPAEIAPAPLEVTPLVLEEGTDR